MVVHTPFTNFWATQRSILEPKLRSEYVLFALLTVPLGMAGFMQQVVCCFKWVVGSFHRLIAGEEVQQAGHPAGSIRQTFYPVDFTIR